MPKRNVKGLKNKTLCICCQEEGPGELWWRTDLRGWRAFTGGQLAGGRMSKPKEKSPWALDILWASLCKRSHLFLLFIHIVSQKSEGTMRRYIVGVERPKSHLP